LNPAFWRYLLFEVLLGVAFILLAVNVVRKKLTAMQWVVPAGLLVAFGGLALLVNRGLPMLTIALLPVLALLLHKLLAHLQILQKRLRLNLVAGTVMLPAFALPNTFASPIDYQDLTGAGGRTHRLYFTGTGLLKDDVLNLDVNACGKFLRKHKVGGPIFNNYDIGSYLIWHLYPDYRVYVDNRPEAYPVAFFRDEYEVIQSDTTDQTWQRNLNKYGFNAIVFYRHDMTTWGQPFLVRRVTDPEWAPVFIDEMTIVFVRRSPRNQALIDAFEPIYGPMLRGNR
jgi:hypothetical protein